MRCTSLILLCFFIGTGTLLSQSVPLWQKCYLSVEGGWGLIPEWGVGHYAQLSLGYQHHDWLGVGVSSGLYHQYSMYGNQVQGVMLHYRAMPKQWRIHLDGGLLWNWHKSDSGGTSFARQQKLTPLLRLGLSWMPWPIIGLGLSGVYAFPFDYMYSYPSTPSHEFYSQTSFFTIHPSLVVNLPGRWRQR